MFHIGDLVCYPMHGVGKIEAIEHKQVLGESMEYYMLRFLDGKITAMVPVQKAEAVGLRLIVSPQECLKVKEYLLRPVCAESDNWNQRHRENMDKLRSGNIYEVADVVKALSYREREKGLSTGERKMLSLAKNVLLEELCVASGETPQVFEALL